MTANHAPFDIAGFDSEFAARMAPDEWHRMLATRSMPGFLDGLAHYAQLMPAYFEHNLILNKVVTEAWRFEILVYALYLHDTRDEDDPLSGLTVANLQKICARQKCASRGRVLAIVGIMLLGGYLRRVPSIQDRRVVRMEPSEAFIAIVEGWNRRIFQIIDTIHMDETLSHHHETRSRFGHDMRSLGAKALLDGWRLLDPFPETNHFVSRDGGWMLLLTCVAASLRPGEGRTIAPISVDLNLFAPRFGVSRSHLRRLLESAHANGLLEAAPRNGANIALSPRLVASFLACMASELGFYRGHAMTALAAEAAGADPVSASHGIYAHAQP
jgi:hypothetical protein